MSVFKKVISILFFLLLPLVLFSIILELDAMLSEIERLSTMNASGSEWLAYGISKGMAVIFSFIGFVLAMGLTFLNSFKSLRYISLIFAIAFLVTGGFAVV